VDEVALSLHAKGPTTGEISAHFAEIYGESVPRETISRITEKVIEEMNDWSARPLDEIYLPGFIDAIVVKTRDGKSPIGPFMQQLESQRGQKTFSVSVPEPVMKEPSSAMSVLTNIRNRGTKDEFFLIFGGLKGLPEVVGNVWPLTTVQTRIIHLIKGPCRLASKNYWDELKRDLRPSYTAPSPDAARDSFDTLKGKWGIRYPAIIRLLENAWEKFIPFLDYDVECRKVVCSTNATESLNARDRRALKAQGHFPPEGAGLGR